MFISAVRVDKSTIQKKYFLEVLLLKLDLFKRNK